MKTNYRKKALGLLFVGFITFAVVPQAKADQVEALLRQILQTTQTISDHVITLLASIEAYWTTFTDMLLNPTPQLADTIAENTGIAAARKDAVDKFQRPLIEKAINTLLSTTAADQALVLSNLLSLPGPDFPDASQKKSYRVGPGMQISLQKNAEGPSPFDIDSLIGETGFPDGSQKGSNCQAGPQKESGQTNEKLCQSYAAQSVIAYLSGLSNPPLVPDFKKLVPPTYSKSQISDLRSTPAVMNYLANLRSYATVQSVGLSNLYHLYAERVIQTGLGKKLQVRKPSTIGPDGKIVQGAIIDDVSPLQVDDYMAKRRINDPGWYKEMETTTSPVTLSREMLYVLAEIRLELYKNRMETERMLVALSALQLDSMKSQKILLDQAASTIKLPESAAASRMTLQAPAEPRPQMPSLPPAQLPSTVRSP
jgi:hypothetical protein